jgi:hypothetical protein
MSGFLKAVYTRVVKEGPSTDCPICFRSAGWHSTWSGAPRRSPESAMEFPRRPEIDKGLAAWLPRGGCIKPRLSSLRTLTVLFLFLCRAFFGLFCNSRFLFLCTIPAKVSQSFRFRINCASISTSFGSSPVTGIETVSDFATPQGPQFSFLH